MIQSTEGPPANVGIDIGGTFTDVVLEQAGARYTAKRLTTHDDPARACLDGLTAVMRDAEVTPAGIGTIIHGTTLATNALIERRGATVSFLTTEGFRDIVEMGTEGRPEQYDINIIKPAPLVPRRRRFPVRERLDRDGQVLIPFEAKALENLLPALDAAGTEALAIGFLHAYANPRHEEAARDFFAAHRPDWPISLSSDISPEFREYERFSTVCANAYVQPLVARYLRRFEAELAALGVRAPLLLMLSSGGLTTVDTACQYPVRLVESGPAGGAIFAGDIAQRHGIDKAMSFDMGGTTAKICLLERGQPQTSRRFEVARVYRFRKDSGLPLRIPVIDMVEIGAGGGSIASVSETGQIAVGPRSAGSQPGPAAYGRGGCEATVTDANLQLDRIDPDAFAAGTMALDKHAAETALAASVGDPLGLTADAVAFAVTAMVCENMASAARVHAIESGKNPDDRTLIAFGGAAPLHVCQLADKLGIDDIVVPAHAGVGSAVGFLRAPIAYELVRTHLQRCDAFDARLTNGIVSALEAEATSHIRQAAGDAPLTVQCTAYMRYVGQGHEIPVLVEAPFGEDGGARLQTLFDDAYAQAFGRTVGARIAKAEIVSWKLRVATHARGADAQALPPGQGASPCGERAVFDHETLVRLPHTLFTRSSLGGGDVVHGPAIISEDETSIVVGPSFQAKVLESGDIALRRTSNKGRPI